ncbi:MAG: metal ABC transporter ATP-binding protein [Bacteroidota bacterium]
MEDKPLIELQNMTAGYDGVPVLRDVNLKVYSKDFIGVIGPNGGGKTTLIKVILQLLKPMKGKVIRNTSGIGYLPQINDIDRQFPITAEDVILSGKADRNHLFFHPSRKEKKEAYDLLEKMGAEHLLKKSIGDLSGGQMQRVLLCRALISHPQILILDEPNTYVDNKFEGELYEMLREYNKTMSIIMVSHDVGMITPYVKTIACVNEYLHYHKSNVITEKQLESYNCPIQLVTHGDVPHTVLKKH